MRIQNWQHAALAEFGSLVSIFVVKLSLLSLCYAVCIMITLTIYYLFYYLWHVLYRHSCSYLHNYIQERHCEHKRNRDLDFIVVAH